MPPKISICLPVFNGERFLAQAIESALNQTYSNFELLISDDCSEDSSPEIVARYARQDNRIKAWRNDSNLGLFANYNKCLLAATGSFLKPFAQDDVLNARIVEKSVAVLVSEPQVSLVSVARIWIDEEDREVCNPETKFVAADVIVHPNCPVAGSEVIRKSLIPTLNFIGEPSTVTFRRSNLGDGFDESLFHLGDLEYWMRILLEGNFFYISEPLCRFRHHNDSSSRANSRGLLVASDLIKLSRKWSDLLDVLGLTQKQFLDSAVEDCASQLSSADDLVLLEELRLRSRLFEQLLRLKLPSEKRAEAEIRLADELLCFRELAYHALRKVEAWRSTHIAAVSKNQEAERAVKGEAKIAMLEGELRELLGSPSWKATKIFRDKNPFAYGKKPQTALKDLPPHPENAEVAERTLTRQEEYSRYLQEQINLVRSSKSWFISQPLRWVEARPTESISKSRTANSAEDALRCPSPGSPVAPISKSEANPATSSNNPLSIIPQPEFARGSEPSESKLKQAPSAVHHYVTDNTLYEYQLAVGAIFRDEGAHLKEWIEFHKLVGVEHFYLFNNHSSDDYIEILAPYIRNGLVDLFEWPGRTISMEQYRPIQVGSMNRALKLARGRVKWLASLDIDEFLFAVDEDNLPGFLSAYDDVGGLTVNWQGFGSSGIEKIPADRLLIESLHRCAPPEHPFNLHVKSVIRPERAIAGVNSHYFEYEHGYGQVNSGRIAFNGHISPYVASDKIRVNHYWSGDLQSLYGRKIPNARKGGWNRPEDLVEERERALNQEESDRSIMRFVRPLREKMGFDSACDDSEIGEGDYRSSSNKELAGVADCE